MELFNFLFFFFLLDLQAAVPVSAYSANQELQLPVRVPVNRSVEQPKSVNKEPLPEWKMPTLINRHISPQVR